MIIFVFSFFIIIFLLYQVSNNNKYGAISFLVSIYVISSFFSLILYFFNSKYGDKEIGWEPMFFYLISIGIIFSSFLRFKDRNLEYITIGKIKYVKILEKFLVIFSPLAVVFFAIAALSSLSGDIEVNRNLVAAGDSSNLSKYGIINSFFSLIANLFVLNILFGFLNMCEGYSGARRVKSVLHLLFSFSYVFYILAYAGRDGVVYWLITFIFFWLFFKDFIGKKNNNMLCKFLFISMIPLLLIFMRITFARFGSEGSASMIFAIVDYAGQQIFNFSAHYSLDLPLMWGKKSFAPLISFLTLISGDSGLVFDRDAWYSYFFSQGVVPWVFTSFIGSFLHDFGKFGTIVFISIISLTNGFALSSVKKRGSLSFSNLLLFILIFQVVSWGVFYYRQYSAFYYLVVILMLFIFFKLGSNRRARKFVRIYKKK